LIRLFGGEEIGKKSIRQFGGKKSAIEINLAGRNRQQKSTRQFGGKKLVNSLANSDDGKTIGQLTGEFVDGQTIGQLLGEFVGSRQATMTNRQQTTDS
jgi:hypothetical protein